MRDRRLAQDHDKKNDIDDTAVKGRGEKSSPQRGRRYISLINDRDYT